MREILLQDQQDHEDPDSILTEALEWLCSELLYGDLADPWRWKGFSTLWNFTYTAKGSEMLKTLDERGGMVTSLARQFFEKSVNLLRMTMQFI